MYILEDIRDSRETSQYSQITLKSYAIKPSF